MANKFTYQSYDLLLIIADFNADLYQRHTTSLIFSRLETFLSGISRVQTLPDSQEMIFRALAYAVEIQGSVFGMTLCELDHALAIILRMIVAVVQATNKQLAKVSLQANILTMISLDPHGSIPLMFADPSENYKEVLRIEASTNPDYHISKMHIPVSSNPHRVLFGAPRTWQFGMLEYITNVQDALTKRSILLDNQSEPIQMKIREYFRKDVDLKSFVSVAIGPPLEPLGVLNLTCSHVAFAGKTRDDLDHLLVIIGPIIKVLENVLRHKIRDDRN